MRGNCELNRHRRLLSQDCRETMSGVQFHSCGPRLKRLFSSPKGGRVQDVISLQFSNMTFCLLQVHSPDAAWWPGEGV